MLFLLSMILSAFSIYLCVIFSSHGSSTTPPSKVSSGNSNGSSNGTWLNWLFLVIQGFFLCVISIIGMRGGHLVDVSLLLTYFWLLAVFVAPVVLTTVACFDFYQYLDIWFKHDWETNAFAGIRQVFCSEGANTLCAVPLYGGSYGSQSSWCLHNYNSTACTSIRDDAIHFALERGKSLTLSQGLIGTVVMFEIGFSMYLCTRILTHSVITESMNDIINVLLILPIAGNSSQPPCRHLK